MAVASSILTKLAKLRALPSCGVAESMMSVSERRASSLARRLRSEPGAPVSYVVWPRRSR